METIEAGLTVAEVTETIEVTKTYYTSYLKPFEQSSGFFCLQLFIAQEHL